jgi:hypothetical protein
MPEGFVSLRRGLPFWPADTVGEADFLDRIGVRGFTFRDEESAFAVCGVLVWLDEIVIAIPGLDAISFVFLAAAEDGMSELAFDVQILPSVEVTLPNLSLTLRVAADVLKPVRREGDEWVRINRPDGTPAPAEVTLNDVGIRAGPESGFDVILPEGAPSLSLGAVMLGDTGIVLEVNGLRLYLSKDQTPPEGAPPGFQGVAIESVVLHFPEELDVPLDLGSLDFEGLVIGTGGFSGLIRGNWTPHATYNETTKLFQGPGAGKFLDIAFALHSVDLRFVQNVPSEAGLKGEFYLPFFERPTLIDLELGTDGSFLVSLTGSGENAELASINLEGLLTFEVKSFTFEREDEVFTVALSGKITPLVAGLDWPAFDLRRLAITSEGDVVIDGGWISLPEVFTLDLGGFKIDVDELGLGAEEDSGRQWFGFSGGIRLIEGIPLSASVEGLKVSWDPALPRRRRIRCAASRSRWKGSPSRSRSRAR